MKRITSFFLPLVLLASACVTVPEPVEQGVQPGLAGFVPARIAIAPCRPWPAPARFPALPLTSVADADLSARCAAVDAAVLKAFDGQPFMRGFSPKFVTGSLANAGAPQLLDQLAGLWRREANDCEDCKSVAAYYTSSLAPRAPYRAWLGDLSRNVRNADAVLLPFVTFAFERRYDDRGLLVAERAFGVSLLLVGTDRGELIWAGTRSAVAPTKRLAARGEADALVLPAWTAVEERVFTEELWRDFPGRQIY